MTKREPMNEGPKKWWASSPFFLTWGGPFVAALLSTCFTYLNLLLLPEAKADTLSAQLNAMFLAAGGGSGLVGAVGMVARSVTVTKEKAKRA